MRTYGAPEANGDEGIALVAFFVGPTLIVAGWAYATDLLQVVLVLAGIAVLAASVYYMIRSRSVGDGG
jgi:hypothetical protein